MTIVCLEEHMATPGLQNLEPDEAVAVQSQANDISRRQSSATPIALAKRGSGQVFF